MATRTLENLASFSFYLELAPIGVAGACETRTDASSSGEFSTLPEHKESRPCPRSHLTSSSPSGNSSPLCCPKGRRATRSAAIVPTYPTGWSSRSSCRSWSSAAPTRRSPRRGARRPRCVAARALGLAAEGATVHLDRGYDSAPTRERLSERGLVAEVSRRGAPVPLKATNRWVVERTNSWQNAHKKLMWCTERRGPVVDFWAALSEVVVIVRRPVREVWSRYRWEGRLTRRPRPICGRSKRG
jgi:hypothetical protein